MTEMSALMEHLDLQVPRESRVPPVTLAVKETLDPQGHLAPKETLAKQEQQAALATEEPLDHKGKRVQEARWVSLVRLVLRETLAPLELRAVKGLKVPRVTMVTRVGRDLLVQQVPVETKAKWD